MARSLPNLDERLRRSRMHKYLLSDETVILAQHQHWAALWKPIALAVGGLFVAVAFDSVRPASLGSVSNFLFVVWLGLLLIWLPYKWFRWRLEWLVATDKRLLMNYGLLNQGVSLINLGRVSDLTFSRTTLGQLLGFGTLVRESAARPRSLHHIKWVRDPDKTYTTICAAIFSLLDRMYDLEQDGGDGRVEDSGPPPPAPRMNPRYAARDRPADPTDTPDERDDEPAQEIPGMVRYGGTHKHDRKPYRQSPDLSQPALRETDAGPMPYRRSTTDTSAAWSPTTNDPNA